jgi:DNA-directed RNA polymerase specialized sigma24 family protein
MTHQPVSQLSTRSTLKLLLVYGEAYNYYRSLADDDPDAPGPLAAGREAALWAAAAVIRAHDRRPGQRDNDAFRAHGPDGLDGFVVALATRWAQHVAAGVYRVPATDAEDVAARVGERLFKVIKGALLGPWMTQPPAPPALADWTRTAVYNELLIGARYRKRHPEIPVDLDDLTSRSDGTASSTLTSDLEFVDLLDRTSPDDLSVQDRQVLTMLSRLEMTQVEAAATLGVSPQAVNQRLTRIKVKAPELADQLLAS